MAELLLGPLLGEKLALARGLLSAVHILQFLLILHGIKLLLVYQLLVALLLGQGLRLLLLLALEVHLLEQVLLLLGRHLLDLAVSRLRLRLLDLALLLEELQLEHLLHLQRLLLVLEGVLGLGERASGLEGRYLGRLRLGVLLCRMLKLPEENPGILLELLK